jgi:uncharacterized protein YdeI (BOF family)
MHMSDKSEFMFVNGNLVVFLQADCYSFREVHQSVEMEMKKIVFAALAILVATPAFAQGRDGVRISAARASAIHACSVAAYTKTYPEYYLSIDKIYYYRACMTEDGQVE